MNQYPGKNLDDIPLAPADETHLPTLIRQHEFYVRENFWRKLRRIAGRLPFSEDLVAVYFCAMDSETPLGARATLLAALAYFILPTDLIPDFLGAVGYSDDAAVLMAAIAAVGRNLKPHHRTRAREILLKESA